MENAELIAVLREVRERVRARNPETSAGAIDIALPDLMPLVHARDAALGKVAAIGTVNPRRGGLANLVVQGWKRFLARVLDWHVREQVEFNRKIVACVDSAMEALNQTNRALTEAGNRLAGVAGMVEASDQAREKLHGEFGKLNEDVGDIRKHWAEWRQGWEHKLSQNEIQFLRSVADLQGAFQHRATLMDANYRDAIRAQHAEFTTALDRRGMEIQQRLWADLERVRLDYEHLIYSELRTIRQRAQVSAMTGRAAPEAPADQASPDTGFDSDQFAERFRGSEDYVRAGQQVYLPYFEGRGNVLDIGCGRGEFLEAAGAAGIGARGIDLSQESVAYCRHKGLEAEKADLFVYLDGLPEASLDGVFCAQVVEHLPPGRLPEMLKLCASRLARRGVIVIETPNPECLAIFATHFYLDPTHTRPVPHPLLVFYLEEFGIGGIEVRKLSPAVESMPSIGALPEEFREAFFGALDYAVIGRKL